MDLDFKEFLRRLALEKGFARVGFASCEPLNEEVEHLSVWSGENLGAPLQYLDVHQRLDPQRVFPEAKTALVGFFPYARPALPDHQQSTHPTMGMLRTARFTRGPDYHGLLKQRLFAVLEQGRALDPSLEGRPCVDSAPILEKALAVRAGLGWIGKHGLLIAGDSGSYGVLGILFLNRELPPDPPGPPPACGDCRACLEACPTTALRPWILDPRLCLSTYTLENRETPPPFIQEALRTHAWVAGCDLCQEACPWNQKPVWGDSELWGEELPDQAFDPESLTPSQWKKLCRGKTLRRIRYAHWMATLRRILGTYAE